MTKNSKELLNHVDSSDSTEDLQGPVSPQSIQGNFTFKMPYFNARWILFLNKINQLKQNLGCYSCSEAPLM